MCADDIASELMDICDPSASKLKKATLGVIFLPPTYAPNTFALTQLTYMYTIEVCIAVLKLYSVLTWKNHNCL